MTEKKLWGTLKDGLDHLGHLDRIESHATSQGRPDVNYCFNGVQGDVELKIYDRKRGGFVLRATQNAWMCNRVRHGGTPWILARYDDQFGKPEFLLIPGAKSRELIHDRSYETWKAQSTITWPGRIDFQELLIALKGTGWGKASPK